MLVVARTTDFVPGAPRLAYDHAGSGPVVVFLHGINGNRTNWSGQVDALSGEFHAVALDARGYGSSDDYAGELAFDDFADDLARFADHLKAETIHVCGLSLGGCVAQSFYARHPQRVASLILCDTFSRFSDAFSPEQHAAFVRLRKEPLLQGKELRDIAPTVAPTLLGPHAPPGVLARVIASIEALHKASYLKTFDALTGFDRHASVAAIKVPTMLIYGSEDKLTPPGLGRAMALAIAGARFALLEGAGHVGNLEQPEAFNALLLEFLRGVAAR